MNRKLTKRKTKEFKNITRFMGGQSFHDTGIYWMPYGLDNGRPVRGEKCQLDVLEAEYDTSFDWLMPVVKRVFDVSNLAVMLHGAERQELLDRVQNVTEQIAWWDLPSNYDVVVEFIEWYLDKGYGIDKKN